MYTLTTADAVAVAEEAAGDSGIRDLGLLEAGTARPTASAFGADAYPGPWLKAAALLHSIVANHPFIDGNKRTGLVSAVVFLEVNGIAVDALDEDRTYDLVMSVADGTLDDVTAVAEALRSVLGH